MECDQSAFDIHPNSCNLVCVFPGYDCVLCLIIGRVAMAFLKLLVLIECVRLGHTHSTLKVLDTHSGPEGVVWRG